MKVAYVLAFVTLPPNKESTWKRNIKVEDPKPRGTYHHNYMRY
jgi:hypothetical protein